MSLWEHLKELKNRLIKSAIGVVIGGIGGWILYDPLLKALAEPVNRISDETGGLAAINFGTIASPADFLQLLTRDPWFAWLRPVSELIVLMDETLDGDEPITLEVVETFLKNGRTLFTPVESGNDFATHYSEALQRDPNVILAHGEMVKSFRTVKRPA